MIKALYPASFDPITNGHIDIAERASKLFDELVVAVFDAPSKNLLFTSEERIAMLEESFAHLPNVKVERYIGLTTKYATEIGAQVLVRGLRTVSDFEYELQLGQNYRLQAPGIEVVCLMTSQNHAYISSTMVKDIAKWGGEVSQMVPPHVKKQLYIRFGRNDF